MVKIKDTRKNLEDLECSVIPSKKNIEDRINVYQHRMELIRTIANCLNPLFSLIVLLKLFHII